MVKIALSKYPVIKNGGSLVTLNSESNKIILKSLSVKNNNGADIQKIQFPKANIVGASYWSFQGKIFTFGGAEPQESIYNNSIFVYDLNTNDSLVYKSDKKPSPRAFSTLAENEDYVWLFGGELLNYETGQKEYLSDLWVWNKQKHFWSEITIKGLHIEGVSKASAWLMNNKLWVYGGIGRERAFDHFIVIDLETGEVKPIENHIDYRGPGFRLNAHNWLSNAGFWLWGGETLSAQKDPFMWFYDSSSNAWKKVFSNNIVSPLEFQSVFYDFPTKQLYFVNNQLSQVLNATLNDPQK